LAELVREDQKNINQRRKSVMEESIPLDINCRHMG